MFGISGGSNSFMGGAMGPSSMMGRKLMNNRPQMPSTMRYGQPNQNAFNNASARAQSIAPPFQPIEGNGGPGAMGSAIAPSPNVYNSGIGLGAGGNFADMLRAGNMGGNISGFNQPMENKGIRAPLSSGGYAPLLTDPNNTAGNYGAPSNEMLQKSMWNFLNRGDVRF